jgi:hypothetical protein
VLVLGPVLHKRNFVSFLNEIVLKIKLCLFLIILNRSIPGFDSFFQMVNLYELEKEPKKRGNTTATKNCMVVKNGKIIFRGKKRGTLIKNIR